MQDILRFRYCIFDVDGTLIDTEKTFETSLLKTISELMGVSMTAEEIRPYFACPSIKVGGMLGYPDSEAFLEAWEGHFIENKHLMKPFDGVFDLLARVKAAGAVTGIATSRSARELHEDSMSGTILSDIDIAVCADDVQRPKPAPDSVLRFMELASGLSGTKVSPQDCIFIGDTSHDCGCAHAAGVGFALADWNRRGPREIAADWIFSDAEGLSRILFR